MSGSSATLKILLHILLVPLCPPFKNLTDDQLQALAEFLLNQKGEQR